MNRLLSALFVLLIALPAAADERARVPAADLAAAAHAALQAKAAADGIDLRISVVGRRDDLVLPAAGSVALRAQVPSLWLRPRVAVPVQVWLDGRKRGSATVWFELTAPATAAVYANPYPTRTPVAKVQARIGAIDLARTGGDSLQALDAVHGQRLRRAVAAGQAVQPDDFEPMPAILAQQSVRIHSAHGAVRLSVAGRALGDGAIDSVISVLPSGASQPVRARVLSSEVVSIED